MIRFSKRTLLFSSIQLIRIEKFVDFIVASRNFLDVLDDSCLDEDEKEEKLIEFFKPLHKGHLDKSNEEIAKDILESFKDRETQTLVIKFPIPEMSADALHPQLLKTIKSICEKIDMEECFKQGCNIKD